MFIFSCILAAFLISLCVFLLSTNEYDKHVIQLAETHTTEEINDVITKSKEKIKKIEHSPNAKDLLESELDYLELWEQVLDYKLTGHIL